MSFRRPPKEVPESTLPASTVSLKDVLEVGAGRGSRRLLPSANVAGVKQVGDMFQYEISKEELRDLLRFSSTLRTTMTIQGNDGKTVSYSKMKDDDVFKSISVSITFNNYMLAIPASTTKLKDRLFGPLHATFKMMKNGTGANHSNVSVKWETRIDESKHLKVGEMVVNATNLNEATNTLTVSIYVEVQYNASGMVSGLNLFCHDNNWWFDSNVRDVQVQSISLYGSWLAVVQTL